MIDENVETAIARSIEIIEKLKAHGKFNKRYTGIFPSLETLRKKPHVHFPIIVEQMQLIVDLLQSDSPKLYLLGVWVEHEDLVNLLGQMIDEVSELQGELGELIATSTLSFGQTIIPGHTLFTLARSVPLSKTYEKIDLLNQKWILESFSVGFLLRLAIESKLSNMMGFKSVKKLYSDGSEYSSDHFPVGAAISFLKEKGDQFFLLNASIAELKKVYDWSCRFVHTGRKEYMWMTLKAIAYVEKLFEGHSDTGFTGSRISNLKPEMTVQKLESELNTHFSNYNSSHVGTIRWELCESAYDETHSFWDTRKAT